MYCSDFKNQMYSVDQIKQKINIDETFVDIYLKKPTCKPFVTYNQLINY